MKNLLFLILLCFTTSIVAQNPLYIPPTITSNTISLVLDTGTTEFYPGRETKTMGANGVLLAPTIIMNRDSFVNITVDNQLNDSTTMHWHGLHVSPENDGGPHSIIPPNTSWNPQFTVMDKAGTFWYHPHLHHHTDAHVSKGIAGMLLVRDVEEAALNLPMTYGVDEFPIIFQTKGLDSLDQIEVHTEMDTVAMVNGTLDAQVDFPAQIVRLRVLNGSSQRVMEFGFSDNRSFSLIGTDGGLLTAPVNLTRYRIAPGQRADILVDLTTSLGQNFKLMSFGSELPNGHYGATSPGLQPWQLIPGYPNNPLNGSDIELLDINVINQTASPILTIPAVLASFTRLDAATATVTRDITFTVAPGAADLRGPYLMNGSTFMHHHINDTVELGATEIWSLNNHTGIAHPFHIHDVQFFILSRNGVAPPPELQGYHDVVLIPGNFSNVQFIAKFDDFASDTVPYMYHCHMLPHEDMGMMGQFLVLDPVGIDDVTTNWENLSVYPNPTENEITIEGIKNIKTVKILSINGAILKEQTVTNKLSLKIDMPTTEGIYLLEITKNNGERNIRKIIHY